MKREEILPQLKERLGKQLLQGVEKSPRRIFVEIKPEAVLETTRCLFSDMQARFQIATGVDTPQAIEILYHWAFDALHCVLTVQVKLNRQKPEIDSCTPVCKATEWIERELWELLGIQFHNHPDLRHLLLKDDWPQGQYPLRRDFAPAPSKKGDENG